MEVLYYIYNLNKENWELEIDWGGGGETSIFTASVNFKVLFF